MDQMHVKAQLAAKQTSSLYFVFFNIVFNYLKYSINKQLYFVFSAILRCKTYYTKTYYTNVLIFSYVKMSKIELTT